MWCRLTRQSAEAWMTLTRIERDAMADLAVEIQQEQQRQIDAAKAKAKAGTRGTRRGR